MVKPFEDEIPNYEASLKTAIRNFKLELEGDSSPFAELSLKNIESLEKDYFK